MGSFSLLLDCPHSTNENPKVRGTRCSLSAGKRRNCNLSLGDGSFFSQGPRAPGMPDQRCHLANVRPSEEGQSSPGTSPGPPVLLPCTDLLVLTRGPGSRGCSFGGTGQREEDLQHLTEGVPGQDLRLEVHSPKRGTLLLGCARSSEGPTGICLKRLLYILVIALRKKNNPFFPSSYYKNLFIDLFYLL